ncbi:MAG: peptide ABC transporter substrate-binding protein [Treponema sp.]|nr:peptide ABC transporter substrate-binding protein [Treponema sp.]
MKKSFIFIICSVFAFFVCTAAFAQEAEQDTELLPADKTFVIVEPYHPHDLNPQTTSYSSDAQILSGLYEGLFSYDPVTLSPKYAIAVEYHISRDKKRWTFKINDKACFSNGEKITAQSVRFSWLSLLSTPDAPYASLLDVIEGAAEYRMGKISADKVGIYANSDDSLSIHLVKPANYLPKLLCHSSFSIIHSNPTVYSGPFYLEDMDDLYYVMKKNPYYWDKDSVALEQITFYQSSDSEENTYYFNTGLADWVTAGIDTSRLINKNAFRINAEFATAYFFFKTNDSVWKNREFRAALFEAIPWEKLRADSYVPATTFVYPLTGYPTVDGYSYTDVAEAQKLMQLAREQYGISKDEKLTLKLEIPENSLSQEKLTLLSDAFAQLGVELLIKTKKSYEYFGGVRSSDSDMFIYTWIGDFADPLAFLELFRSDSSLNDALWKNKEYDALLEEAAVLSEEERYKLLAQAEIILMDDCIVIPIYHPVISNVIDLTVVGGWSENAFDIHPLKYLYKKPEKTTVQNVVIK